MHSSFEMEYSYTQDSITSLDVDGIVIGVYKGNEVDTQDTSFVDNIQSILDLGDFDGKAKQELVLYHVAGIKATRLVFVGLGEKDKIDSDTARIAAALGAKKLRSNGAKSIALGALAGDAQATAEGVVLGLYQFDELKKQEDDKKTIDSCTFVGEGDFTIGVTIAESQNVARRLAELPANIATPKYVTDQAQEFFSGIENVALHIHDEAWARERDMNSFLSVAAGSDQPAKFLEIHYKGGEADDTPIIYVGKGITFDTGGISIKGSSGMGMMRGDMGGAAAVIGTLLAISKLGLSLNVIGLTPLTENMPSGKATKPADVVFASNGKSIEIDNTDAEGRLILADALVYADSFNPDTVIDIATLTGAMMVALGDHYIGTFSRSDDLWNELHTAGEATAEKVWRMPLDKKYSKQLKSTLADLKNVGGRPAGAITAAMFLSEFSEATRWAHLDIAGTAWVSSAGPYKIKGMTGVPVRTLTKFAQNKTL